MEPWYLVQTRKRVQLFLNVFFTLNPPAHHALISSPLSLFPSTLEPFRSLPTLPWCSTVATNDGHDFESCSMPLVEQTSDILPLSHGLLLLHTSPSSSGTHPRTRSPSSHLVPFVCSSCSCAPPRTIVFVRSKSSQEDRLSPFALSSLSSTRRSQ